MRSVDNDELFQVLFKPKKILDDVDRQLKYDRVLSAQMFLLTKTLLLDR